MRHPKNRNYQQLLTKQAERKKLNKPLYITGFIISPIIALYGIAPFYLFNRVPLSETSIFFIGITINVLINCYLIIYLNNCFPKWSNIKLFVLSFIASVAIRAISVSIINLFVNSTKVIELNEIIYLIITALAINGILIIIIKSIVTAKQKHDVERHLQEIKLENADAQLKILMQQLQPHFLFNSLSTLKSMIADNPDRAEQYILRLSDFLRYSVQATNTELVNLEIELQFVKDYIELQKERFEKSFSYHIEISNDNLSMQLPVMALQAVVENIFKHNYFTLKNPLFFTIKSDNEHIIVQNQKQSIRIIERSHTGLLNLNKRFELLVRKPITIEDGENKFIVKLPLLPQ